jgi:hypothetical protein
MSINESAIRKIIRQETLKVLRESTSGDAAGRAHWASHDNGMDLAGDVDPRVSRAWSNFRRACRELQEFGDMEFPDLENDGEPTSIADAATGLVSFWLNG